MDIPSSINIIFLEEYNFCFWRTKILSFKKNINSYFFFSLPKIDEPFEESINMVESCPSSRIRPKDPNDTSGGFEVQGDKTKFATLQRQRKQLYDELRDTKCRAQVYKKLFFPNSMLISRFFFTFLVLERSSFISFTVCSQVFRY